MRKDPFELLSKDHQEIARFLGIIARTNEEEVRKREEIFRELKQSLEDHSNTEETILYPILRQEAETFELSLEGVEKHRIIEDLLEELHEIPTGNSEWTAKFMVLKENVESHIEEEETEMFDKAQSTLSEETIDYLGERIAAAQIAAEEARTY